MDSLKEYQSKRAVFLKIIPLCFIMFFISIVLSFFIDDFERLFFFLAILFVGIAIATQVFVNKCPNCGESQFGTITIKGKLIRTRGWVLNPMSCPWCKTKLNES
jgi:predicted RNA-binding Zn-ribbon protein involved in translation (DUF1610 family)